MTSRSMASWAALRRAPLWEGRQGALEVVSETVHKAEVYPLTPLANFIDELADFHSRHW